MALTSLKIGWLTTNPKKDILPVHNNYMKVLTSHCLSSVCSTKNFYILDLDSGDSNLSNKDKAKWIELCKELNPYLKLKDKKEFTIITYKWDYGLGEKYLLDKIVFENTLLVSKKYYTENKLSDVYVLLVNQIIRYCTDNRLKDIVIKVFEIKEKYPSLNIINSIQLAHILLPKVYIEDYHMPWYNARVNYYGIRDLEQIQIQCHNTQYCNLSTMIINNPITNLEYVKTCYEEGNYEKLLDSFTKDTNYIFDTFVEGSLVKCTNITRNCTSITSGKIYKVVRNLDSAIKVYNDEGCLRPYSKKRFI